MPAESGGSSVSMGDRNASAICWRSVTAVTGLPQVSHCPDAVASTVFMVIFCFFPCSVQLQFCEEDSGTFSACWVILVLP